MFVFLSLISQAIYSYGNSRISYYICQLSSQIDAHNGSVGDLAFAHPDKQFLSITCGEDKTIKVWVLIALS